MKVLVLSDCHGDEKNIFFAIRKFSPDKIIFLGDGVNDFAAVMAHFPKADWYAVRGNCDRILPYSDELLIDMGEMKVLAVHGDKYNVKSTLLSLSLRAREKKAAVALFGHTHFPLCENDGEIWYINPGSCRPSYGGTCALMEITGNDIVCSIHHI